MTKANSVKKNLLSVATLGALGLTAFGAASVNKTEHVSAATNKTYTVKSGDTLSQIATDQNTTVKKLAGDNKISNPNFILPGQTLQLSAAATTVTETVAKGTYTVKAGDTLSAIARANGVTVAQLVAANNISNPNFILVGQQLQLSGNGSVASSAASSAAPASVASASSAASSTASAPVAATSVAPTTTTVDSAAASSAATSTAAASTAAASSASASVAASQAAASSYAASVAAASSAANGTQSAAATTQPAASSQAQQPTQQATNNTPAPAPAPAQPARQAQAATPTYNAPASSSSRSAKVANIIRVAEQQLGVPYVWGGSTPAGFDCSGLVAYAFQQGAGVGLGHYTVAQENAGTRVSISQLQPGDIVFWGSAGATYHDAVYIGNNQYVAAPQTGDVVKIQTISSYFMPSFGVHVNM